MAVRLILDSSALVAYAELSSVAPGELILQVDESGDTVGVSAPAFVEAFQRCKPDARARLAELIGGDDTPVTILALTADDLVTMGSFVASGLPLGTVHTAHEADQVHECSVLTAERVPLERLMDPDAILDV
jgi:hypothetical protein